MTDSTYMTPDPDLAEATLSDLAAEVNALHSVLTRILTDLPNRRDWLDPDLERQARGLVGLNQSVWYSFTVYGYYPNGNKTKMQGHLQDRPGSPQSAFLKAVKACEELTPGLIVDMAKPGQVILQQLRGKPRRL